MRANSCWPQPVWRPGPCSIDIRESESARPRARKDGGKMRSRLLSGSKEKTFAIVMESGDEVMATLVEFASANHLSAARFTGIGAFSRVVLGYFDWQKKEYLRIPLDEQVELVSLLGDVALEKGEPKIHAHIVL